jgi:phage internal scaffolding protein
MSKVVIRTAFSERDASSDIHFGDEPSLALQSMADECDINHIMRRFELTGELPFNTNTRPASYGDFTQLTDYQSSLNLVIQAEEAFMSLPAVVRDRFNNGPSRLIDFVSNDANYEEAKRLGLLDVVDTPTAPASAPTTLAQPEARGVPPTSEVAALRERLRNLEGA